MALARADDGGRDPVRFPRDPSALSPSSGRYRRRTEPHCAVHCADSFRLLPRFIDFSIRALARRLSPFAELLCNLCPRALLFQIKLLGPNSRITSRLRNVNIATCGARDFRANRIHSPLRNGRLDLLSEDRPLRSPTWRLIAHERLLPPLLGGTYRSDGCRGDFLLPFPGGVATPARLFFSRAR